MRIKIINNNFVQMIRNSAYKADFLIEEGKTHSCVYKTPFGEMSMDIVAKRVNANIPDCSGKILLCYTLQSNKEIIGENNLLMKINEIYEAGTCNLAFFKICTLKVNFFKNAFCNFSGRHSESL